MKRGTQKKLVNWLIYLGTIVFWALFWLIVFFIPPSNYWRISGLMVSLFLSFWLTFYFFFKNLFWGVTASFYIIVLLFLQLIKQLNWLNFILISAACLGLIYRKNKT